MKNKLIKNFALTLAVSSVIAVPVFAQNINIPTALETKITPINYIFKHWAEVYVDQLSIDFDIEEIFKDKNLNDYITAEDFKNAIKLTIDKNYENAPEVIVRETVVYELAKIWAEKSNKNLDTIPMIKMLIYSDTGDIDVKYLNGVYVAYMYDIAKGRGEGIFDPKTNVTYGELAVLIKNTKDAIEKEQNQDTQPIVKGKYETKGRYEIKDDKVVFDFELMSHFTKQQQLMMGSGQQFELTITNDEGEEVYKFSDGKAFTLALLYKTLEPGESLKWQDEWNMTDKDGKKVNAGKYKAEIEILVITEEDEKIEEEQLKTVLTFTLREGTIESDAAKEIIKNTANDLLEALKNKDADKIADYVHPVKGVRFTPYTTVSIENDVVMSKENMKLFFEDENSYIWGSYDGIGEEIKLTPSQYYEKFIYTEDFISTDKVGYNKVLSSGNSVENQFDVYKNSIIVEYYLPEINPEYEGLDWQSLRLVFEEYDGNWKLVGIIHNQWTI